MKHTATKILLVLVLASCLLFGAVGSVFAEEAQPSELNQLLSDIQGLMTKYGPEISEEVQNGTKLGTLRYYSVGAKSHYVAIGEDRILKSDKSYADLLAADLGIGKTKLKASDLLMDQIPEKILKSNGSEIKKADLITINLSINTFAKVAVSEILGSNDGVALDWNKYVAEEGVAEIKATLDALKQYLIKSGVSGSVSALLPGVTKEKALVTAAESFAYGTLAYAVTLPQVLDQIHTLNPNARIIVVGMDNPLSGASIKLSSGEIMDLGGYVGKLIKMTDNCAQTAALERQYVTFVSAPDAENANDGKTLSETQMILAYLNGVKAEALPNSNGNGYINERIQASFRKMGDVDGNGSAGYADALKILRSTIGLDTLDADGASVADVDGNGSVGYTDALKILRASINLDTLEPKTADRQNMTDLH